ncbi:hypothetical protein EYC79_18255 [Agrobacterium cavarae]|uniref:Uncharacterized protein n=1 Tax=Agrobacterium cavarae TaxID=2528239 RepID=A0ABY1Y6I9_9HYPH|nr:hypothetical protein [Agrobacterium cavarae]TBN10892.1 hypothetical protein EYC79_18255 [Agrobacterium cavarae]
MPKQDLFARFDMWWSSIGEQSRAALDEQTARMAFVAGCRVMTKALPKQIPDRRGRQYRFQCGRWKVTVIAKTAPEAKEKAIGVLDRRAEKFMTSAPVGGWYLSPLGAHR